MNNPLISVVTVSYNAVATIEKTILSVINQEYSNVEYIVIDGGSTDGTVDIIKKYVEKITFFVSEPDKGVYDAMNKGVIVATGEWINFMNAGDTFYDRHTFSAIFELNNYKEDIISGGAQLANGKVWRPLECDKLTLMDFYISGLCHQATFIRKKIFGYLMYDENLKIVADSKFFIQSLIMNNCSYRNVDVMVCCYDWAGISADLNEQKKEIDKVMRELLPEKIYMDYVINSKYYDSSYQKILKPLNYVFYGFLSPIIKKIRGFYYVK